MIMESLVQVPVKEISVTVFTDCKSNVDLVPIPEKKAVSSSWQYYDIFQGKLVTTNNIICCLIWIHIILHGDLFYENY